MLQKYRYQLPGCRLNGKASYGVVALRNRIIHHKMFDWIEWLKFTFIVNLLKSFSLIYFHFNFSFFFLGDKIKYNWETKVRQFAMKHSWHMDVIEDDNAPNKDLDFHECVFHSLVFIHGEKNCLQNIWVGFNLHGFVSLWDPEIAILIFFEESEHFVRSPHRSTKQKYVKK